MIGRIITASPNEGERYFLQLLLNHVRGPKSYDDLKTVGEIKASTFREAAILHNLLEVDNSIEECLEESILYEMPNTLRRLFAIILAYCAPNNPQHIWKQI